MTLSTETLIWLFCAGGVGGFIDSIAGGGGLITVPALLAAGLPPQLAFGTNKAQSSIGTIVAVTRYARGGLISWAQVRSAAIVSFIASAFGAWAVTLVSNDVLKAIVPWLLLAIVAYVMFSPKLGEEGGAPKMQAGIFGLIFGSVLGFYDGFFGPGTGAFWTIAVVAFPFFQEEVSGPGHGMERGDVRHWAAALVGRDLHAEGLGELGDLSDFGNASGVHHVGLHNRRALVFEQLPEL